MKIPNTVNQILSTLEKNNYEAYIVGGCIRDTLIGKTPKDWDICTNATPQTVVEIFEGNGIKVIPTGIKYGTVTLMLNNEPYEITTYRKDGDYSDGRRPNTVIFSYVLEEDLSRRDFTMNAIAYNPSEGFVDPFNGIKDISNKIIRTVGEPDERFKEDALRMLRAARFSATLGFEIEEKTKKAIIDYSRFLKQISKERISSEFIKIVVANKDFIKDLQKVDELNLLFHIHFDIYFMIDTHVTSYEKFQGCPRIIEMRMAILLHTYKEFVYEQTLKDLKFSNAGIKLITKLIKSIQYIAKLEKIPTITEIKMFLFENNIDFSDLMLAAEFLKENAITKQIKKYSVSFFTEEHPHHISHLSINGKDIEETLNIKGREVGDVLRYLAVLVIEHPELNIRSSLINHLQNNYKGD